MPGRDRRSGRLPGEWLRLKDRPIRAGGQATAVPVRHPDGRKGVYRQLRNPISDVERRRFKRELEILSSAVQHRGIVKLHEWNSDEDRPWYISELGGSFPDWWKRQNERFRQHPTSAVGSAVSVVQQLASALAVCHEKGVVHRDIKPSNVVVKEGVSEPWPILIDFGIAHQEKGARLTPTGDAVGNARFSPDVMRDRLEEVRPWVDVFGLAQLLIWMLDTGSSKNHWQRPVHWQYAHYSDKILSDLQLSVRAFTGVCSNLATSPADASEVGKLLGALFVTPRSASDRRVDPSTIANARARGAAAKRVAEASVQEEIANCVPLATRVYEQLRATVFSMLEEISQEDSTKEIIRDDAFRFALLGATDLLWVTVGPPPTGIHFRIKAKVVPWSDPPEADKARKTHLEFWRRHMPTTAIPFTFALEGGIVAVGDSRYLDGRWITILRDGTVNMHPLDAAFGRFSNNDLGGSAEGPGAAATIQQVREFVASVLTNAMYWEYIAEG